MQAKQALSIELYFPFPGPCRWSRVFAENANTDGREYIHRPIRIVEKSRLDILPEGSHRREVLRGRGKKSLHILVLGQLLQEFP